MTGEIDRRLVWDRDLYKELYEAHCRDPSHVRHNGTSYTYGAHWYKHMLPSFLARTELLQDALGSNKRTKVLVAGAGLGMLQGAAEQRGATSWRSFDDSRFILAHQHPKVRIHRHDLRIVNQYYDIADWIVTENCLEEYSDFSFLAHWPSNALHIVTEELNPKWFHSRTLEEWKAIEPRHLWMSAVSGEVM